MIRLAILVSVTACVASSPPDPNAPSGGGGGSPPAGLVGSWYSGAGGISSPYDPSTGTYGMPNGQGLLYVLRADGSYTKAFQSYTSTGGCTTGFSAFENGAFASDGTSLQTSPANGTLQYRATCAPSMDSDKPITALSVEQFSMTLAGDQLTLVRSDGVTGVFRRL